MMDLERLTHETLYLVTERDLEKCVQHAEKIQDEDSEKKILRDCLLETIIVTFASDESDSDDDKDIVEGTEILFLTFLFLFCYLSIFVL